MQRARGLSLAHTPPGGLGPRDAFWLQPLKDMHSPSPRLHLLSLAEVTLLRPGWDWALRSSLYLAEEGKEVQRQAVQTPFCPGS